MFLWLDVSSRKDPWQ